MTYIWVCIISGYGKLIDQDLLRGSPEAAPQAEASAADAEPMSRSNQRIDAMRGRCRNTLHLAAGWMADSSNREFLQAVVHLFSPLRQWHGSQNQKVRSPDEARAFFIGVAAGEGLKPLELMMQSFQTLSSLEPLGFCISCNLKRMQATKDLEFDLREEASKVQRLIHISLALIKHRVMSMTHYMYSFPGAFVLALSSRPADRQWLLQWVKRQWEAFEGFENSGLRNARFWKLLDSRSVFRLQLCRTFFRQALASNFESFDAIQIRLAADLVDGLCQSKVVEDTVHVVKESERYESRNALSSSKSKWVDPIKGKVLCDIHRYPEVSPPPLGVPVPKETDGKWPKDCGALALLGGVGPGCNEMPQGPAHDTLHRKKGYLQHIKLMWMLFASASHRRVCCVVLLSVETPSAGGGGGAKSEGWRRDRVIKQPHAVAQQVPGHIGATQNTLNIRQLKR